MYFVVIENHWLSHSTSISTTIHRSTAHRDEQHRKHFIAYNILYVLYYYNIIKDIGYNRIRDYNNIIAKPIGVTSGGKKR